MSKPESTKSRPLVGRHASHLLDDTRNRRTGLALVVLAIVGFGLLAAQSVLPLQVAVHGMYLPTVLAAYFLGLPASSAVAILAGVLLGLRDGTQSLADPQWFVWLAGYLAVALAAGSLITLVDGRRKRVIRAQIATLRSFAEAVESDDESAGAHCERVAKNSRALGAGLGLPLEQLEELYWAGLLHDIGKVTVPREILMKPDGLTFEEYLVMRRHARLGANLLGSIDSFTRIARGVGTHHERWDGSGYPGGLKGEDIPLFGRILAVVDVFEALSSDRPYRPALPCEEALRELRASSAAQFDPAIVDTFERLYRAGQIEVAPAAPEFGSEQPRLEMQSVPRPFGGAN